MVRWGDSAAQGRKGSGSGWTTGATRGAAWLALALSLALTAAAWRFADARERQAERAELHGRVVQIAARLSTRMLAYEQLLRGASGLFAASGPPTREAWQAFVGALGLAGLPGIEGMGWAPRIEAAELERHVASIRRDGMPGYRVHPSGDRDVLGPVVYFEPMTRGNARAIGFDMYGEPVRRAAMQAARDAARPSLTGRVLLVQENGRPEQAGVLAYLPVYRRGAPAVSVEERRAALLGWVYAAFRAGDFVEGAIGGGREDLEVEVRDARDGGAVLHVALGGGGFDAEAAGPALRVPVPMADREWELRVRRDAAAAARGPHGSTVTAIAGTVGSLLIFGIVWSIATTRARAVALADRMTAALRQSHETLESRVRERTASLHDTNLRLAAFNDALRAVNAAFRTTGAPGPVDERLSKVAAELRRIVPATIGMAVAFGAGSDPDPVIAIDAGPALPPSELERWRRAALESERSAQAPTPGGAVVERLPAPLLDAHGHARGYLLLGRREGAFTAEDIAVVSQFALLVGSSLSLHETLARERHARAEAERADRAKDEMLAVVSHELRTPLNAIQGWLHVLRRRRADDAQLLGRALEVIQRNLDTQLQLVEDLLDTARIVSGQLRLSLRPVDLVPLLRTAIETVRPLAEARQISVSVSVPPEPFLTVGDPSRLEQVIWNLLTNAVKFTGSGGHVAVRLERLGWLVQIEIEDDGQGIEAAFLPHVFDRFRQADSSSTRAAGGLGLGLALVQHIVQAHGGQVMVRSDGPGRGACFTVSLPLGMSGLDDAACPSPADQAPGRIDGDAWSGAALPDAPDAAALLAGLHVLVVEDHDDSRELLADFLSAQGATVSCAANAHEAMSRVRELPPDGPPPVLLCDIALPGQSGYELLARIREHERQTGRPQASWIVAIALSAFTRAEDRERSLRAGFVDHLGKPLSQGDLIERLVGLRDEADGARPQAPR